MATHLEELSAEDFRNRLRGAGCPAASSVVEALHAHYQELRRWAARVALIGSGEADAIVERHYAESLSALPLIEEGSAVIDLGSGAGFPGYVLAAARPESTFWLFESRARKAAFLRAATAKAKLSCRIVDARVSRRNPVTETVAAATVDFVTVRGVKIDSDIWAGLEPGLASGARILRWQGATPVDPWPNALAGRTVELGGEGNTIQEWIYRA